MESPVLIPSPGTPLVCHVCQDIEAPQYRLRRQAGKYILLCYKNGEGCWERHPARNCEYTDNQGVECTLLAEWTVGFGKDQLVKTHVCSVHVGAVLSDVSEHTVTPLDE